MVLRTGGQEAVSVLTCSFCFEVVTGPEGRQRMGGLGRAGQGGDVAGTVVEGPGGSAVVRAFPLLSPPPPHPRTHSTTRLITPSSRADTKTERSRILASRRS